MNSQITASTEIEQNFIALQQRLDRLMRMANIAPPSPQNHGTSDDHTTHDERLAPPLTHTNTFNNQQKTYRVTREERVDQSSNFYTHLATQTQPNRLLLWENGLKQPPANSSSQLACQPLPVSRDNQVVCQPQFTSPRVFKLEGSQYHKGSPNASRVHQLPPVHSPFRQQQESEQHQAQPHALHQVDDEIKPQRFRGLPSQMESAPPKNTQQLVRPNAVQQQEQNGCDTSALDLLQLYRRQLFQPKPEPNQSTPPRTTDQSDRPQGSPEKSISAILPMNLPERGKQPSSLHSFIDMLREDTPPQRPRSPPKQSPPRRAMEEPPPKPRVLMRNANKPTGPVPPSQPPKPLSVQRPQPISAPVTFLEQLQQPGRQSVTPPQQQQQEGMRFSFKPEARNRKPIFN